MMIDALMLMLVNGPPEQLTHCVDTFQNCGKEVSQGLQGKLLESLTALPIGTVTVCVQRTWKSSGNPHATEESCLRREK